MMMLRTCLIACAGLLLGAAPLAAQPARPATENLVLSGLKEPVEIIKDKWGIPHIYAKNESDLFFAQGYNIARDRLFQLEMRRRQATGTVAEVLGPKELKRDIVNRLFTYRGDLDADLSRYHPNGKLIITAFANGINAYIDATVKNPALLTPEFQMLGFKPVKWTPADVVSRVDINRTASLGVQLNNALAIRAVGVEKFKDLKYYQPNNPDLRIDPAIDQSLLSEDILDLYRLFVSPLRVTADQLPAQYRREQTAAAITDGLHTASSDLMSADDLSHRRHDIGSNNWVVGPSMTMSGFPLIAGDPHRPQSAPPMRYWVHLVAPGWNVIGVSQAGNPGVAIGHNEYGGWGLTTFGIPVEDLMVYDTNPANSDQYKYRDGWETMKTIRTSIPVKGQAARNVDLKYTRHGPVIFEDKANRKAYGMRAAYLEPGGAAYLPALRMDQAKSWEEFVEASVYYNIPAENMVWGDRDGNIGYQAVGIQPLRPNFSGEVPVPGDGRYEWAGFLDGKLLPHIKNPPKGYYNTSNDFQNPTGNLAETWPDKRAMHYQWADSFRGRSVREILESGRKFTVADMIDMQNNDFSIPARTLTPMLRDISIANPVSQKAVARLLNWNHVLDKDSVEAGIYEMFQRQLLINVRDVVIPASARSVVGAPSMTRVLAFLTAPDGRFGPDPIAGRDAVLVKSLDEAIAELTRRLGSDMETWRLGAYHYAKILHPMSGALNQQLEDKFTVGPAPRGGDSYTISATGGADNQTSGGSFKHIFDTEDWDNSVGLSNPGQSGDVNDPHYRDLFPLWANGKYFPVFFSRAKIESVSEKTIHMTPR